MSLESEFQEEYDDGLCLIMYSGPGNIKFVRGGAVRVRVGFSALGPDI